LIGPVFTARLRRLRVAGVGSRLVAIDAPAWQRSVLAAAARLVYGSTCAVALKLYRWGRAR
jgi:hypothetical protein